jgi:hypothetical protein
MDAGKIKWRRRRKKEDEDQLNFLPSPFWTFLEFLACKQFLEFLAIRANPPEKVPTKKKAKFQGACE